MIPNDKQEAAWASLHAILLHAKCRAYELGNRQLGDLLNDAELLPEYFLDHADRTDDIRDVLASITTISPEMSHVLDAFDHSTVET